VQLVHATSCMKLIHEIIVLDSEKIPTDAQ